MDKVRSLKIYRWLVWLWAVLLCATLYVGYHTLEVRNENKRLLEAQLTRMDDKIIAIEKRLATLTDELAGSNRGMESREVAAKGRGDKGSPAGPMNSSLSEIDQELQAMKEIIASTGLDQLAAKENIDPEVFNRMYSEYAEQKKISDSRQALFTRNEFQHQLDSDQFDDYVSELYNRARFRRGTTTDSEDREEAFTEMLDKYPDAYATAMLIAERAFTAMWSRDPAGVENYYAMLKERDSDIVGQVVTDRGIEALPNIEIYLVRQYLRDGRETNATVLSESLQDQYPESMVFMGGRGRGGRWLTVAEALGRISTEQ